MSYSLKKCDKILKRKDFLRTGHEVKKIKTRHFIIICNRNNLDICRVGITVTKKIGNAVIRNRIKRVLREFFRLNRHSLSPFTDYIFIAGRGSHRLCYSKVFEENLGALIKKGFLKSI